MSIGAQFRLFSVFIFTITCLSSYKVNVSGLNASDYLKDSKIVGGTVTTIDNVPYIVNLRARGQFYCGGTLVTDQFVVTAAHCVNGRTASEITVIGGASLLSQIGVRRTVSRIFQPSNFNANTLNYDVAVLKLSDSMTGPNISPIGLCESNWQVGSTVRVSGWGITSENGNVSNQVRTVLVKIVSKLSCARSYRRQATLTRTMFCAAGDGKDSCSGDSGGPVVFEGRLCGVVSFGVGCARQRYPGVYTNIREVREFINKALSN